MIRMLTAVSLTSLFILGCASNSKKYASPNEWVEQSKANIQLPLAANADEWSEAKDFATATGPVTVRSKFLKQQGTTCHFDVEFKNNGTQAVNETAGILASHQNTVYSHNNANVKLPPGKGMVIELEGRECPLNWGTSKDLNTGCAACMLRVAFVNTRR